MGGVAELEESQRRPDGREAGRVRPGALPHLSPLLLDPLLDPLTTPHPSIITRTPILKQVQYVNAFLLSNFFCLVIKQSHLNCKGRDLLS